MRVAAMRLGRNAVCAVAFGSLVLVGGATRADESAADAIAEKFSSAAEDSERREAEAKKAEAERAVAAARKLEARRKTEAERKGVEQRKADEADMLEQAKAEAAARQAEEQRQAEAARRADEAEERRLTEETRKADAAQAELETSRAQAAQCVADKFRLAQEARSLRAHANAAPAPNSSVAEQPTAPINRKPDTNQASILPTRITVLLVIQPRNGGHFTHTANPILCIENGCYISGGLQTAADYMPRSKALGPLNSIGRRAGLCQNQLRCAFRDVDLGGAVSFIQPVDMGLLHHDRREVRKAEPDQTCDVAHGRLYCSAPIIAHDYRAWVVPEFVAAKAGAATLEEALEEGLPASRSAWLDAQ